MSTSSTSRGRRRAPVHARPRARRRGRRLGELAAAAVVVGGGAVWYVSGRHPAAHAVVTTGSHVLPSAGRGPGHHPTSRPGGQHVPPLVQPSAAHPLSVLEIGDSLGVDLGLGLDALLGHDPRVQLHTEAVGDTGLANVPYYNWPATLERELRTYHPGLVVVFIGGNDAQGFDVGSRPALFGTSFWHAAYSARVRTMMREATATGAHVLWAGMPVMGPSSGLSPAMAKLDAIYAAQAKHNPRVRYLSTWRLFEDRASQYATALPNAAGQLVTVRDPDGVHLTMDGSERVASAVVTAVDSDWHVHL